MTRHVAPSLLALAIVLLTSNLRAQPAQPTQPTQPAATQPGGGGEPLPAEIDALRKGIVDAYNAGDMDRMLSYCHPNIVVAWQNGEVSVGREAIREYYNKMMVGPNRVVEKLTSNPVVEGRHVEGDTVISYGRMNDHFVLRDPQTEFTLNSRFSATLVKRGDQWLVRSFHQSGNLFDNPVMSYAARRVGWWSGVVGLMLGLVLGWIVGVMIGRRRRATAPNI
jgi:ketosteroid isomerase-like protein